MNGVLAWALFQRSGVIVLAALTAVLAGSTLWFNPIARGGSGYCATTHLLAIDAEAGRGTRWAVFNTSACLLPVLGLGTLSGTFPVPQLALWSRLDHSFRDIYDRYAHILVPAASRRVEFSMTRPDKFFVSKPLEAETLRRFGATHVALVAKSRLQTPPPIPASRCVTRDGGSHGTAGTGGIRTDLSALDEEAKL